jgi:hypothetical protein
MRRILTILTLSVGLLALPGTAMADRDKDRAESRHSDNKDNYDNHRQQADRNHHVEKHADRKYQHKKYQHKKYRAETIRQHKLATKRQDRISAYRHFNDNNYHHWRERRDYKKHSSYRDRHGDRELRKHYYRPNHDRYRTHYLRYHRGHKRSHHQHDDNYLEWVTTMLLLNELLDDDYR